MPPNKEEDSSSVGSKSVVASKSVGISLFQGLAYEHSLAPYYGDQKGGSQGCPERSYHVLARHQRHDPEQDVAQGHI